MKVQFYSRKQAGVIFANYKRGNINADNESISLMYNYADWECFNGTSTEYDMNSSIRECIDNIFQNNYEKAQQAFDRFVNVYNLHYC